jgi:hypothetical protein
MRVLILLLLVCVKYEYGDARDHERPLLRCTRLWDVSRYERVSGTILARCRSPPRGPLDRYGIILERPVVRRVLFYWGKGRREFGKRDRGTQGQRD